MTEVVCELSGSHGRVYENAIRLIEAAARAGADTVKFQCFRPDRLAKRRATHPDVLTLAGGVSLLTLYQRIWTPPSWFPGLIEAAQNNGLAWFSSVFDPEDVAFLETLGCPRYKISAFEMLDWDIIKAVRETGKPIVMSVRPVEGVTILHATGYDGRIDALGLSAHGDIVPPSAAPMVEYHLKLEDVETPDSEFSLTEAQLRRIVRMIRS
jgi:sialic acid synthase SpsE